MKTPHSNRCRPRLRAFTLVEVTLALGVIAFALVAILGTLPVGLGALRDAGDRTTRAEITRHIGAELSQLPFSKLDDFASAGPYGFDVDGNPDSTPERIIFQVRAEIVDPSYPGVIPEMSNSLVNVRLEIENTKTAGPGRIVVRNIYVAKSVL